jgi:hypothetical protein
MDISHPHGHEAKAAAFAESVASKLQASVLVDNDAIQAWRFQENKSNAYAFDLIITRFGTSAHGDMGNIAFNLGFAKDHGLALLAESATNGYLLGKVVSEMKEEELDDAKFLDWVLTTSRERVLELHKALDFDVLDPGDIDVSGFDIDAMGLRELIDHIEKLETLPAAENSTDLSDDLSGLRELLNDLRMGFERPESIESARAWMSEHEKTLGASDTFELSMGRPTHSLLFKLHLVHLCAKKALALQAATAEQGTR